MTPTIITVEKLRKVYGEVVAVADVTFSVKAGEIFGLLGPNGAGKTTTLECLEGLRLPDSGLLQVAGIDPTRAPRKLRNVMGVQLQSGGLPENITPDEAMRLFCAYHGVAARGDLLDRFGLAQKRKTQFYQLSTGQQRRLSLALAVAHLPQVLILDEPTAGLDVASRKELHDLLRELRNDGATIMLATHDMAEAEALCDRIAILLRGELTTIGSPLEVTATGSGLTKVSVRTLNGTLQTNGYALPAVQQRLLRENYVIYYSRDIVQTVPALINTINASQDSLIDLRVERPSLEERFLELTS